MHSDIVIDFISPLGHKDLYFIGGGRVVLGKISVPGRPTYLDNSGARAYCSFSRCGWGYLDIFLSSIFSLSFLYLWETDIVSQWAVKPKTTNQPTNQPTNLNFIIQ